MMSPRLRALFPIGLAALGYGPVGCRCEEDRPYTPFGIASTIPSVAPPPSGATSGGPASAPTSFEQRLAAPAPVGSRRWRLGGRDLSAPDGQFFLLGLVVKGADGTEEDAVVWTVPATESESTGPGQAWLYPPGGEARKLWDQPAFVPTGPSCRQTTRIAQTGPGTVTVDVSAECEIPLIARSPVRSLAVLSLRGPRAELLSLRLARPAPDEDLDVHVRTVDRDGDGRDDIELNLGLRAKGTERPASASMVWLDRAAGPSREPQEPLASLRARASLEQIRAKGKNTGRDVPDAVSNLRRLAAWLCAELDTPRLFDAEGSPWPCGSLTPVTDSLLIAEVRAALVNGEIAEAFAAIERDGWYGAPASAKRRSEAESAALASVTRVTPTTLRLLGPLPPPASTTPRYSPLSFEEPAGSLLIQTSTGLVRASSDGSEVAVSPDAGTLAWPLSVESNTGAQWTGITHACNRSELELRFTPPNAAQVTRLLAARPGVCSGGRLPETAAVAPLGFDAGRLSAIVGGAIVGPQAPGKVQRPAARGTPRSEDGTHLVIVTPLGLLVSGPATAELWQTPQLQPYNEVRDCVVANGGRAAACIKQGRVYWLAR